MLFHPAHLPYWIFLAIGVSLFLLVSLTGGGDGDLDAEAALDAELDGGLAVDADFDLDAEAGVEGGSDGEGGFSILQWLAWLGLGRTPFLLLLAIDFSAWGVAGWFGNALIAQMTGSIPQGLLAGAILSTSLAIALWTGKVLSYPIGRLFATFGEDASSDRLIGCVGTVTSKNLPYLIAGEIGQASVFDNTGNLLTVSVSLPDWATVIPHYKDKILLIDRRPRCFLAIAKDTSDEDRWLNSSSIAANTASSP
jgi:hypothetical protein